MKMIRCAGRIGLQFCRVFGRGATESGGAWRGTRRNGARRNGARRNGARRLLFALLWMLSVGTTLVIGAEEGWHTDAFRFAHLTVEDGLSQNSVMCVCQDRRGFIWLGTQNGLNRFDGYRFLVFKHDPERPDSLSDSWIHRVAEDRRGFLWVATLRGLNRLCPETGGITRFYSDPDDPHGLAHDRVETVMAARDGRVWVGTGGGGVSCLTMNGKVERTFRHDPRRSDSLSNDTVWSLLEDVHGFIWIGTKAGGLNRLNPETGRIVRHVWDASIAPAWWDVSCLMEDASHHIWVGTLGGGAIRLDPASGRQTVFSSRPGQTSGLTDNRIWTMMETADGHILVGTDDGGLNVLNPETGAVNAFTKSAEGHAGLNDNSVYAIEQDRSGIIWVGTLNGGVNRLRRTPFTQHLHTQKGEPNALSNNNVRCIVQDSLGDVWIGTRGGGLNRYDPRRHTFEHFLHRASDPTSITSNIVWAVLPVANGDIWIGTSRGLDRFDAAHRRFIHPFRDRNGQTVDEDVNCLMKSRRDALWIGTWGDGLKRLDLKNQISRTYRFDPDATDGLSHDKIYTIYEDRAGTIWVGSRGGLDRYRAEEDTWINTNRVDPSCGSLSHQHVTCLFEDDSGNLWIGTWAGGLNLWRAQDRQANRPSFSRFTEEDGISADLIAGIVADGAGDIWISSNQGLYRYRPATQTFNHFGVKDGLQDDDFNPKACCRAQSGELYFGGINGVTVFHPDHVVARSFIPPIRITSFRLFNQEVSVPGLLDGQAQIVLDHTENYFSFEFSALDYASPDKNRYAYRMDGIDEDWVYTDHLNRRATYTNLHPGGYQFRVKGTSSDGVWSDREATVRVTIVPPIWDRTWFKLLVLALGVGLVLGYFRLRMRHLRWQREQLKQLVSEQTRELQLKKDELERQNLELQRLDETKNEFLGVVVHDMRHPVTAIIWLLNSTLKALEKTGFKTESSWDNLSLVLEEARRLKAIVNSLLDLSAIETGKLALNLNREDFNAVLKRVEAIHRINARDKDISLTCETTHEPVPVVMDGKRIEQVLDNLLDNAVKYTHPGGSVRVFFATDEAELTVQVEDTGQGLSQRDLERAFVSFGRLSAVPTAGETSIGYGLAIVKKIIDLHGGRVWVDGELGRGATFGFALPLNGSSVPGT